MREEDVLFGETTLVTGLEEASEVGRDPERREIGCCLRGCWWRTAEVTLFMLGGTLRSCVSWGDSSSLWTATDRNLKDTRVNGRIESTLFGTRTDFLIEYDCRSMQLR